MKAPAAVPAAARAARWIAACTLLWAVAAAQARQVDPLELRAARQAHRVTVLGERALLLLAQMQRAPEAARLAARREIAKARAPGAAATGPVPLAGLIRGRRALDPAGEGEAERLQRYMDALDVRVVPGVFEARAGEDERPVPLTLQVEQVLPATGGAPEVLSAWWIAADGSEQRARREPVDPALMDRPFELYVHAPKGPPGVWSLVLQGERGDAVARGIPLAVEGVHDVGRRLQHVLARDDLVDGWAFLAIALARLHALGTRSALAPLPSRMLEALEERDVPRGTPHPLRAVFVDEAEVEHWLWTVDPPGGPEEPELVVLLLAPGTEAPELALAGDVGRRWLELALARKARLYSSHLPVAALEGVDALAPLASVRARHPDARILGIARGDTWGRLSVALRGREDMPLDALVVQSPLAAAAPREDLAIPWLLVAPGGAAEPGGKAHEWLDGDDVPLLGDPLLPEQVAAWLRAREALGAR